MTQFQTPPPASTGGAKLVVIALILAVTAVVLNSFYINYKERQRDEDVFEVFVATRSAQAGDFLREKDFKPIQLPRRFQESFAGIGTLSETELRNNLSNRLEQPVVAGELLSIRHYTPVERDRVVTAIKAGTRLVSLPVNSRTLPGALRKGMAVDIEAPFQTDKGVEVMPVMEDVEVIALGNQTVFDEASPRDRPYSSYQTITIQVSPQDATMLANIVRMALGNFEIQLRNPSDDARPKIPRDTINPDVVALWRARRPEAETRK